MDNSDKSTPHKAHDINNHIEEEDLWDLGDEWNSTEQIDDAPPIQTEPEPPIKNPEEIENEPDTASIPTLPNEDEFEPDDETPPLISQPDLEESKDSSAKEPSPDSKDSETKPPTTAPALKKNPLSGLEKTALSFIAILLLGLAIWGYIFLLQKNTAASDEATLSLPAKGEYAVISKFSTIWITPKNSSGVKLGVTVVPSATITLGEGSSSGALRVYFWNAQKTSIGDPITISFSDGKFSNGSETIEVSASDGFHMEGDFHAYQMDPNLAWKAQILEAASNTARGSDFKELFTTKVEPKRH